MKFFISSLYLLLLGFFLHSWVDFLLIRGSHSHICHQSYLVERALIVFSFLFTFCFKALAFPFQSNNLRIWFLFWFLRQWGFFWGIDFDRHLSFERHISSEDVMESQTLMVLMVPRMRYLFGWSHPVELLQSTFSKDWRSSMDTCETLVQTLSHPHPRQ